MTITIQVATDPDKEYPVAELWYGPRMIAEINQEAGADKLTLEIYESAKDIQFSYRDFTDALLKAEASLKQDSAFTTGP